MSLGLSLGLEARSSSRPACSSRKHDLLTHLLTAAPARSPHCVLLPEPRRSTAGGQVGGQAQLQPGGDVYGPRLGAVVAAAACRRRAAEATEAPEATDAAHAAHAAPVDVVAPIDVAPAEAAAPALLLMGFEQAALGRGR